jgi:hypothetical protein
VLRVDRDRQGAIRLFPGANLAPKPAMPVDEPEILDVEEDTFSARAEVVFEPVADPPIVDAEPVVVDAQPVVEEAEAETPKPTRRPRAASPRAPRSAKTARPAKPRARKSARPAS